MRSRILHQYLSDHLCGRKSTFPLSLPPPSGLDVVTRLNRVLPGELTASPVSQEVACPDTRAEISQYLFDKFYKKGILPTVLNLRKGATDVVEHEIDLLLNSGAGECFRQTDTGKLVGLNPAIVWPVPAEDGDGLDRLLSEKNAALDWYSEAYFLAKRGDCGDDKYRAEVAWRNFHYLLVNRFAQMHARRVRANFVLYLFGIYLGTECRGRSPSVAMLSANMSAEAAHQEGGCMMLVSTYPTFDFSEGGSKDVTMRVLGQVKYADLECVDFGREKSFGHFADRGGLAFRATTATNVH